MEMLTIKNKKMPKFKANTNFKMSGFPKHDLTKNPTGPRAEKTEVKQNDDVPLSPGFEDPIKIQKVQREGLTPDSQKFHKKAKTKKDGFPAGQTAGQIIRRERLMLKKKDPCWKNYEMVGMKMKGGRKVPNCVPKN
tara:strand:+ start:102 stop:509 length:408 start_codon:yes stop_codon:yes gene_type:complete